jgi:hypothetical protein
MQMLGLGRYWVEMSDLEESRLFRLVEQILEHRDEVKLEVQQAVAGARQMIDEVLGRNLAELLSST